MNPLQIWYLLNNEWRRERRSRFGISAIILYSSAVVFICYMAFREVPLAVWNTLFWIVMLFVAINVVAKSFLGVEQRNQLYYYTTCSPLSIFISKVIYNTMLMIFASILTFGLASIFLAVSIQNIWSFLFVICCAAACLSISLTFIAAISSQAKNGGALLAVLGFPILVPALMVIIRLSGGALNLFGDTSLHQDYMILFAISLITLGLGILLFPIVWKD